MCPINKYIYIFTHIFHIPYLPYSRFVNSTMAFIPISSIASMCIYIYLYLHHFMVNQVYPSDRPIIV